MNSERFNMLLRRLDIGDETALREISDYYCKLIKWAAFIIIKDWQYADDILNEVLILIWNNSHKYKKIESPTAWIRKVTENATRDFFRKHLKKHKDLIKIEDASVKDLKHLVHNDDYSRIEFHSIISDLDNDEKEIVLMRFFCNATHEEIAQKLKMPSATVRWKYQKILDKLEKVLSEENNSV